ncbi:uncharacterized protein LOC116996831 [Catharus ustulatus]|uniref:uncharacterized protein LOC116996831 n=1 Tax=Catharus ustulatus TaxID=91951 RepID=UPI00140B2E5F|nr:uncharacterized protein LOC116996831 [Catharus ustulatus]
MAAQNCRNEKFQENITALRGAGRCRAPRERQRENRDAGLAGLQRSPGTAAAPCSGPPGSPRAAGGTARLGLSGDFLSHRGTGASAEVTGSRGSAAPCPCRAVPVPCAPAAPPLPAPAGKLVLVSVHKSLVCLSYCVCEPSWSIATIAGTAEISSALATTDHFGSHTLTFHGLSDNRLKTALEILLSSERKHHLTHSIFRTTKIHNTGLQHCHTESSFKMDKISSAILWVYYYTIYLH